MHLEWGQIFTQVLSFLVMLWVLKRYAWAPLLKILHDRQEKIEGEFAAIEQEKSRVDDLVALHTEKLKSIDRQTRALLKEAQDKGEKLFDEIEHYAQKQAKFIVDRAKEEAQSEIEKAKVELKNQLIDITINATQKIIQTDLTPEKQKQLIEDYIEKAKA